MHDRSIKVKIIKETSSTITVHFSTLNRKMPIPRKDFENRVKSGLYEVIRLEEEVEGE